MKKSTARLARDLLAKGPDQIHELIVREFDDDEEAHDDELQARLERSFVGAFESAKAELTAEFGKPCRVSQDDDPAVGVTGGFRSAAWEVGKLELGLVAAHEDRELPFLLVLGTRAPRT